jgi:hypothetical protein
MRNCRRAARRAQCRPCRRKPNWSYGNYGPRARRIAARRMMAGRNMAAAVADQYGYGPGLLLGPSGVEPVSLALLEALAYLPVETRASGYLRQPWATHEPFATMSRCDHLPTLSARDC